MVNGCALRREENIRLLEKGEGLMDFYRIVFYGKLACVFECLVFGN